jgi:hypothetical protein
MFDKLLKIDPYPYKTYKKKVIKYNKFKDISIIKSVSVNTKRENNLKSDRLGILCYNSLNLILTKKYLRCIEYVQVLGKSKIVWYNAYLSKYIKQKKVVTLWL